MNDILARRARRATVGIALSAALVAGIAPATATAAETSSPTGAVALQTEDAAAAIEKAYAAMQEALKNLEAAKDAAGPEKLAEIDDDIAAFQELYDMVVAEAAKRREPLPAMQADIDAAQAKYDEAHNLTSGLQAELDKALEALGDEEPSTAIKEQICSCAARSCRQKGEKNLVKMIFTATNAGSKARKNRFSISKVRQRKLKPTSTRTLPSEMRSLAIWKRRKRPMTTPAKYTKRQRPRQTRPPRPR